MASYASRVYTTCPGRRRYRLRGMEVCIDGRRQVGSNDGSQRLQAGALYTAKAAEMRDQPIARLRAHPGNCQQVGLAIHGFPGACDGR